MLSSWTKMTTTIKWLNSLILGMWQWFKKYNFQTHYTDSNCESAVNWMPDRTGSSVWSTMFSQTKEGLMQWNQPKSWWRNQMETFFALPAFCHRGFPSQRPVTRSFFFDLRLNQQLSKQWRRRWFETPLRLLCRHCNVPENSTNEKSTLLW